MRAIETIYQEMLAAYAERRGGQIEEDCELAVRLWAAAAQVQALEAQADWVLAQSFPQTAAGEYLDRHAAVRGLKRQAAAKAVGTLTFTAATAQTGALTVPEGTVCMTEGAVRFRTTELGMIPAGETSVTVAAEAVETGAGGNVGAGAVHVLTACPVAGTAVTNEALRVRVLDTFLRLPNGANAAWYELTACRHAGVTSAKAVGRARGIGTVDVYVSTPEGVPGQALLTELQTVFQKSREIAVDVQVKAPEAVEVNMTLTVKPAEGTAFEAAKAAVESELAGFFGGRLLGQSVKLAELYSRIYALDAVENCRITLPAADTEISATELPVLGTVSITEEA